MCVCVCVRVCVCMCVCVYIYIYIYIEVQVLPTSAYRPTSSSGHGTTLDGCMRVWVGRDSCVRDTEE